MFFDQQRFPIYLSNGDYLYALRRRVQMSLSVSFYRPLDYFGGVFNRFVSWFTAGDFCHCELVVHTTPTDIMTSVKQIYHAAQQGDYAPEDCQRIITEIELNFFTTEFRKAAQTRDNIVLSFSLLWGQPMSVRVLTETAHDSWFKIPQEGDRTAVLIHGPEISDEHYKDTLKFSIEELGKKYNNSGAICSVLPSWSQHTDPERRESYFCSEFTVMVFQRIGFMSGLDPEHTTPNSLYQYLKKNIENN